MTRSNESASCELSSSQASFGGKQNRYKHFSKSLQCDMVFSVYLPPQAENNKVPVLYWLSGLTCNDENFSAKAGAQRVAAELGIALVIPDTSPRGDDIANDDAYDMGQGAGFYLNATQSPWNKHFFMYDYIVKELPQIINAHFPVNGKQSISGHSMGGHGALTIAIKNVEMFQSVSAFSPIVNPANCPWGIKAFTQYLGENRQAWQDYDTIALLTKHPDFSLPMLVDQGTADNFLAEQLKTDRLITECEGKASADIRYQVGYDHSYYFIATFIEEHLRFHAKYLF